MCRHGLCAQLETVRCPLLALLITALAATPVMPAEIFGAGTISTAAPEFAASLTADGSTIYFNRISEDRSEILILTAHRLGDGSWSPAEKVPFTGVHRDVDPFITADGRRLFFSSNRPAPGEEEPRRSGA